jgi:hypothetical protein
LVTYDIRTLLDVNAFVVVPLHNNEEMLGVIVADNKFNQAHITSDVIELLKTFAVQAAFTVESHYHYQKVKSQMNEISKKQDAIIESEKMAAVGRIAAHIAHEIRNPLVTMGGYARRVINLCKKDTPDMTLNLKSIEHAGEIILNESERLEKILSNVMDFTKPAKQIKEFNDMNLVVQDTFELLKNLMQEKRIETEIKLKENMPLIKSDFNQMKQVVLNLIQNSLNATPVSGKIEIITDYDKKYVILKVLDTGTGFLPQHINHVFEPFFTTNVTGVGLGLPNVLKIIKDHGGEIEVKNRDIGGAEVTVFIPISKSKQL